MEKKPEINPERADTACLSLSCHYRAAFYFGATVGGGAEFISFWLPLTPSILPLLCKEGGHPDYAPCGCNDKDLCAAVRECARTLLPIPHPWLYPTQHTPTHIFCLSKLPGSSLQQKHGASRKPAGTSLPGFTFLSLILPHAAAQEQIVSGGEARAPMIFLSSQHLIYPPKRCHFLCLLIT